MSPIGYWILTRAKWNGKELEVDLSSISLWMFQRYKDRCKSLGVAFNDGF